jgi:hypothetical protein
MTQQEIDRYFEERKLVFKDICGRLPYIVHVQLEDNKYSDPLDTNHLQHFMGYTIFKPYLFPLSSMTEEQKYDFYCRFIENDCDFDDFKKFYLDNSMWHKLLTSLDDIEAIIDWFHKNHFDYRGLIPMGLAIDATGKNIY